MLLTRLELAKILKVSLRTVDKLKAEGMPHLKITDSIIRFNLDEVLNWLRKR